jgi:hypothetical protein
LAINKISAGRKFSLLFYAEDNEAAAAIAINNLASSGKSILTHSSMPTLLGTPETQ